MTIGLITGIVDPIENMISNGQFMDPDIDLNTAVAIKGWNATQTSGGAYQVQLLTYGRTNGAKWPGAVSLVSQAVLFNYSTLDVSLWQTVRNLAAEQQYTLSFYAGQYYTGSTSELQVLINNVQVFTTGGMNFRGLVRFSFVWTPTATSATITFKQVKNGTSARSMLTSVVLQRRSAELP